MRSILPLLIALTRVFGKLKESIIHRETFVLQRKSAPNKIHQVVIAIHQNNLDVLEDMLMERSHPNSTLYQNWLSVDEIHQLTRDDIAYDKIINWLATNNVNIVWTSPHQDYIKASAPIYMWESLLSAQFYEWKDIGQEHGIVQHYDRSYNYSIPGHLSDSIFDILQVAQATPIVNRYGQKKTQPVDSNWKSEGVNSVNVGFLNSLYAITTNTGLFNHILPLYKKSKDLFNCI
jgi:subtilase family serine protease